MFMNFGKSGNSPNYFRKFGLDVDPFPVDTFDNILFLSPDLKKRLDTLKDQVINSEKLVLVTGKSGGGKSILADYLKSIPEENWTIALVQAFEGMDRETLAYEIIQKVSPDTSDDKSFAIPQLHKLLEVCAKSNKTPVLIVDDSQDLPVETLVFIFELTALKYGDTTFRFVLFANEELAKKFKDERLSELGKEMTSHVILPPFNREQVKEYIDTRLRSAGDIEDYPFDEGDLQDIFKISSGVPKDINIVARELMQAKPGNYGSKIQQYRTFILAGVITVLCLVVYNIFFTEETEITQVNPPQVTASSPAQVDAPANDTDSTPSVPGPSTAAEYLSSPVSQTSDVPDAVFESGPPLTVNDLPEEVLEDYEDQSRLDDEQIRQIEEAYNQELDEGADVTVTTDPNGPVQTYEPQSFEAEPVVVQQEQSPEIPSRSTSSVNTREPPQIVSSIETEPRTPPESTPVRATVTNRITDPDNIFKLNSVPRLLDGIKGENWYRQQDRSAYVLQLISASNIANVIELLEGMPGVQDQMSGYVKYTPSGRPRFLLFYGVYPDRDSAIAATSNIPARFRALNPYPRVVDNIIDEIEVLGYWPR
jgi:type II secretory pathway predicted ATPase ExeA/septal ring-binding cell division protein DamX